MKSYAPYLATMNKIQTEISLGLLRQRRIRCETSDRLPPVLQRHSEETTRCARASILSAITRLMLRRVSGFLFLHFQTGSDGILVGEVV